MLCPPIGLASPWSKIPQNALTILTYHAVYVPHKSSHQLTYCALSIMLNLDRGVRNRG